MFVTINGNDLNVEVIGPGGAPVPIAHHGGGIGSLPEPKATFGPPADEMRVLVFDVRGRSGGVRSDLHDEIGVESGSDPFQ